MQAAQLGSYDVVVTDNAGMGSITSSIANLYLVTPPVIVSESPLPTNQVVFYGTNVTLSVMVTAPGQNNGFPLAYQWQFDGTNIPAANAAAYTFNATATSFGTYSLIVSNAAGSTNATWQVTVVNPGGLLISQQPANQYQIAGGSVNFFCGAVSSNAVVTYQWQFDSTNIVGATSATLTVTNVQAAQQQGYYDAVVSDVANSLTSSNSYLYLVTRPVVTSQTLPTNQAVLPNGSMTLNATASAPGETNGFPLAYQWQFDGTNIAGQNSPNYTFFAFNSGTYSVIVSNAAGSTNATWQVTVVYPGNVWGWGDNGDDESSIPFAITNIASIAAGENFSVAAEDNGKVIQWGANSVQCSNQPHQCRGGGCWQRAQHGIANRRNDCRMGLEQFCTDERTEQRHQRHCNCSRWAGKPGVVEQPDRRSVGIDQCAHSNGIGQRDGDCRRNKFQPGLVAKFNGCRLGIE